MTRYRVQRMTNNDYSNYMGGGNNYSVDTVYIEADSPKEAAKKAKEGGRYVVNKGFIKTVDEYEQYVRDERERFAKYQAEEKAREEEKVRKEHEKLIKNAGEAGVSDENAEAWQKKTNHLKRLLRDIKSNEAQIKKLTQTNIQLQKEVEELQYLIAGFENRLESEDTTPNPSLLDYQ